MDFENKKLCLVGGSSSIKGSNFGKEIDESDIVIRVNCHWPDHDRSDVGHETNILIHNGNDQGGPISKIEQMINLQKVIICNNGRQNLTKDIRQYCRLNKINFERIEKEVEKYGYSLTTGLYFLTMLMTHEFETLKIFGFDFYQNQKDKQKLWHGHKPCHEQSYFEQNILTDERVSWRIQ